MQFDIGSIHCPLFDGIDPADRKAVLGCTGYHIGSFRKGEMVAFEQEHIRHIGLILSGTVDMVKEDLWGGKSLLLRFRKGQLFGETFACGDDSLSSVSFAVSEDAKVLFIPFDRVLRSCSMACEFHHRLMENLVRIIANKNQELIRKVEVISKRSIREKLLSYLSLQAQAQGSRYFSIPLSRVELADYLCVDRSAMTRELSCMRSEGLIDYDKNLFRML